GIIEPLVYRTGSNVPTGGGILPANIGASYIDPWKHDYGYCAWDQGPVTKSDDHANCGGTEAGRLNGSPNATHAVIAVISAGPNGVFESACYDWVDVDMDDEPDVPTILRPAGSDDIIRQMP